MTGSPTGSSLQRAGAVLLAAVVSAIAAVTASGQTTLPELTGRIVDMAGILSDEEEAELTRYLAGLETETSVQIVLVSVPAIEGAIEDYTIRLAEHWGLGQAESDNGVLVLVSVEDRRARIEVGYGLESVIPDGLGGRILRDELAPRFANGEYAAGFRAVTRALGEAARGEYTGRGSGARAPGRPQRRRTSLLWILGLLLAMKLLGYVGTVFHPAGASALGAGIAALFGFLLIGIGSLFWLVPLGLVAGIGATAFRRASADRSGWGYGGTPGGGGAVWGGSALGSGLGRGFAGFSGGGGSFGGGGASGSW